ncbi:PEP-CTERM sorting domain-containing protein [Rhodopila sp.]|jgi:hypothetical protein|uniref:PEP-CTERM sorting domain-containing protein n=1 Tax=Rhodopila sp. TaxID=2480087 RepID=UPI002C7C17F7|nr:PEP-CTERM sorting domain-containing protein [Rhodopila sp.]HVZ09843.1 PEP-CTERM sorting domain-containing protein [Rhodopila sp.]
MRPLTLKATVLGGLLASVAVVSAQATPVTFSGIDANGSAFTPLSSTPNADAARNDFFSNLNGVGTETFETLSGSAPLTVNFGAAGTATLNGSGSVVSVTPGTTNGAGRYSVPSASSSRYWEVTAGGAGTFSLAFSSPIAAFGFYGIDIGDFNGTVTLELTDTSSNVTSLTVPTAASNVADGSVLYFGFYDLTTQYTSITFATTGGTGDVFAFDNFSIGSAQQVIPNPVPEPMSLAVIGTGLLGLRLVRRRRG